MIIHVPTPLRAYTGGQESISVDAGTVSAALEALVTAHPGLRQNLFGADGKLRSFVNVYLNEDDIRYLNLKEDTPTKPSDELTIIPSIAGGCQRRAPRSSSQGGIGAALPSHCRRSLKPRDCPAAQSY